MRLAGVIVLLVSLLACRRDDDRLVVLLSPGHATADEAQALGVLLSREAGVPVEVRRAPRVADVVAEAGSSQVDAGIVGLFQYLLAHREYGVVAGLQVLRGESQHDYHGVLWGKSGGPAQLRELEGKRVAFVDRSSATGYLLAARHIEAAGVRVEPVFTGSHEASLTRLRAGEVEAMATFAQDAPEGVTLIAATGRVPNEPVFFRRDLPTAQRERLVRAFLKLASTVEGRQALERVAGITGFEPADDARFVEVGRFLEGARHHLEDLVPGGWQVVNEHRRPLSDLGQF
jgi:phosphonate transport system substrate-binding protein